MTKTKILSPALPRCLTLVLLPLLLALLLAACGSPASAPAAETEAAKDTVIVVMGPNSEPEAGFDPAYGWGAGEHVHEPLIQSTLTVTTAELEIGYDLATDLQVSDDGLTWTVTIRDDVRFSDGQPLTAADVAFTYNTVKAATTVADFTMLDQAEAIDDATVVFRLHTPCSIWPYTMACVGILPQHAYGPDYGRQPIGSGRYLLKQWDQGQQLILEANPDYYGQPVRMERVIVLFMEEDAAFAAVKAGQVDLAYTAAAYSDQEPAGYQLLVCPSVDNRGFNLPATAFDGSSGNDVTADLAIRQAINIGLDRELIIRNVLQGYGAPAYSVCDQLPWYNPACAVSFDRDGAIALLEAAGWQLAADGVRVKNGLRAELNIMYPASDSLRQALAAEAANQLALLGVSASVEGVSWDVAYDRAQCEVMTWGWGAHTPMELYNIYHSGAAGSAKYSPYANPQVDAYMDQALQAADLDQSYALWQQAQWDGSGGVAADLPWVWLVNIDHLYWAADGLQVAKQKIHPHGHGWSVVNNVDQWYWD